LFVLLAFGYCLLSWHYVFAQTDQAGLKLQAANAAVEQTFKAVLDAEKAGANVNDLLDQLNYAAGVLAKADNSYRAGDFNKAAVQADNVLSIIQKVTDSAQNSKQTSLVSGQNSFWFITAFTIIGVFAFVLVLFLVWRRLKRIYTKSLSEAKLEVIGQ
jgi:hypothetical protein